MSYDIRNNQRKWYERNDNLKFNGSQWKKLWKGKEINDNKYLTSKKIEKIYNTKHN